MWTATESRARSALTIVALLVTMTLIVAAIVFALPFALQWASPIQTHIYQTYDLVVTPPSPWQTGQSLSLQWLPSDATIGGPGPAEPPRSVTCTFSLYGPYPTQAAAQQAVRATTMPGGGAPLAASAPSRALSTDVGAPAPTPLVYALPNALAPGYYVVVAFADGGDSGGGSSTAWVAEVTTQVCGRSYTRLTVMSVCAFVTLEGRAGPRSA